MITGAGCARDRRSAQWRVRKTQKGSGLVEYAIVLTAFLLMFFGIVDFSRAMYAYHFVSSAARDAARWAAVNGYFCGSNGDNTCSSPADYAAIRTYVTDHLPLGIDSTKVTFPAGSSSIPFTHDSNSPTICSSTVTINGTSTGPFPNYPGCTVQVQVNYAFNFIAPIVNRNSITLSSTSEMVIVH
jgi:Flp pilus assembly protein TadG